MAQGQIEVNKIVYMHIFKMEIAGLRRKYAFEILILSELEFRLLKPDTTMLTIKGALNRY